MTTSINAGLDQLAAGFADPPRGFHPIPFWWWTGGRLEIDRLAWELDQLKAKGVHAAIISYNHLPNGEPDLGDPPVYSPAWWELLRDVLTLCEARGMSLGFQDYCLLKPRLAEISARHPEVRGAELRHIEHIANGGETLGLSLPPEGRLLEALAFPTENGTLRRDGSIDISAGFREGALSWTAPAGCWTVVACYASPAIYDPLHPESGALALEHFYGAFERNLPGALGRTLTVSFQDELDFGGRFPLWSAGLADAFHREKSYPLNGRLAELFIMLDSATAKFRLDFHDVSTRLAERGWFEPVYRWHEERGLLFGHDNAGRGAVAVGGAYYGDTMRAMRWYSAPGSDDPNLGGPRAFKGIKVASSIAHLYDRPRVWAECFHSSGWGIAPAKMRDGLNALFALGATVINLHGLYYSTYGGWWEWAPPDFHFRQPYWLHMDALNAYVARLSWLLAQGRHACDVAILYPSETIAAGLNGKAGPELVGALPLSEAQRNDPDHKEDLAEALTFAAGEALFDAGVDFDFLDCASLSRATSAAGRLTVGAARYSVLVLAEATALPWTALQQSLAFSEAGGRIVILGRPPLASDRQGAEDPVVDALVAQVLSRAVHMADITADLAERVHPVEQRTIAVRGGRAHLLHRVIADDHIVFLHNPADCAREFEMILPIGVRVAEEWDAQTGQRQACLIEGDVDRPRLKTIVEAQGARLLVMSCVGEPAGARPSIPWRELMRLPDTDWAMRLVPTLDNHFGDFELPSSPTRLGPATGRVWSWHPEPASASTEIHPVQALEDAAWRALKPGFAPRMALIGPFPAGADRAVLDAQIAQVDPLALRPVTYEGTLYTWRDYAFSLETGVEDDPVLKSWDSGPHGLKGLIPDEFIDLPPGPPGQVFYLVTSVWARRTATIDLVASSRSAHTVWLDGEKIIDQPLDMGPGRHSEWRLPHYQAIPRRAPVHLGPQGGRLAIRLIQPEGERIRAYVAPDAAKPAEPRLRWFGATSSGEFRLSVSDTPRQTWLRVTAPPGLRALILRHRGAARVWVGESEAKRREDQDHEGGTRFVVAAPLAHSATVLIQIIAPDYLSDGDLIIAPIEFDCGDGLIALGDWTAFGLEAYSGAVLYSTRFELSAAEAGAPIALSLGDVAATCDVRLNGMAVGALLGPPWTIDLSGAARPGENQLEILVANTLANFYAFNRPTPYASLDDIRSGLFGPIVLLTPVT